MEKYYEFDYHLMQDYKPSIYFNEENKTDIFERIYPYTLIGDLKKVHQSPEHHPEGNVWNHTMLVIDNAAQRKELSGNPRAFMWTALLHDLGKGPTTKLRKGKITSYDHDIVGQELSADFLKEFTDDLEFINQVSKLVRWHMQILHVVKGLPYANIEKMTSEVSFNEIALLGLCDRLGRGGMTKAKEQEEQKNIDIFINKCREYLQHKSPISMKF
jgi:tRNA nucleotidyltransferase (CCA-adding enzyme)